MTRVHFESFFFFFIACFYSPIYRDIGTFRGATERETRKSEVKLIVIRCESNSFQDRGRKKRYLLFGERGIEIKYSRETLMTL